jgi:dihydroorotase
MSEMILRGGRVLTPQGAVDSDVRIVDQTVTEIGQNVSSDGTVIDASGCIVGPGFVDLHVHLREPGQEWKEDIATGSAAAAAGGFTAIVAMPNTDPPTDSGHLARYVNERGRSAGLVEVVASGCITAAMKGESLAHLDELYSAGVRLFTDDGVTVADAGLLRRAMEYLAGRDAVVAQHAEDPGLARGGHMHEGAVSSLLGIAGLPSIAESSIVARDIELAALTGARYHVQHVSCAETVELIRDAKARGLTVTAEVAPHHLTLGDEAVHTMDPVYKMYPPLRSASDVAALVAGLEGGTIDAVATDHAPHASHEKDVPFEEAPRGVIGLETAFAVVRSSTGLDPKGLFDRISVAPARIGGFARHGRWVEVGVPANLTVVEWDTLSTPTTFLSKSTNSPFLGRELIGSIRATVFEGQCSFNDGEVQPDADSDGETLDTERTVAR